MNNATPTNADTAPTDADFQHKELTAEIIGGFFRSYDPLGFGFLESVYCNALAIELSKAGIAFEREVPVDVLYDGEPIGHFRADFLVESRVIVEVKASETLVKADRRQLLNYLRASEIEVGLLLHFGPKPAFHRVVYSNRNKSRRAGPTTQR